MSYTLYPLRKQRLQRSTLAVPGSNPTMIDRAIKSAADYVFLDCEDAVAPPEKEQARKNIIQALNDLDWKGAGKTVCVRINGLDTHYMYRDVVDIMEQAGSKLDTFMIPKVGVPADVYVVECMVSQIEEAKGYKNKVGTEALIETPLGMANVEAIASAPSRLEALHFGVADYAAFNKARTVVIGGLNPDYPGDQWHFALSRMTVACRALWPAADRWPVRRHRRSRWLQGRRSPRSSARHRRQMGYPPLADRTLQRRLLADAERNRARRTNPRGAEGSRSPGQGRCFT